MRYYEGETLEKGKTSINGKATPGVRWLFEKGHIKPGMTVLDYGAGKYGRNSKYLREQGVDVFSYDPFNFNTERVVEGWDSGRISNAYPEDFEFDVVLTCYVLNVVPKAIEDEIVAKCEKAIIKSGSIFHITRSPDIMDTVKPALLRDDKTVTDFFNKFYAEGRSIEITDKVIWDFCKFGVQTSKGFQRVPCVAYGRLRDNKKFMIFHNKAEYCEPVPTKALKFTDVLDEIAGAPPTPLTRETIDLINQMGPGFCGFGIIKK